MSAGSDRLAADLKVETLSGGQRALAEEAIRIKARLDRLELLISGDRETWFDLAMRQGEMEVVINAPLVEARQQGLALRSILAELAKQQGAAAEPAKPVASKTDDLKARREKRFKQGA